jgi:hypothetical protein
MPRARPPVEDEDFERGDPTRTREVRRVSSSPRSTGPVERPSVERPSVEDEDFEEGPSDEGQFDDRRRPNRPLRANRSRPFRG